jgi:hypothetical protein
MNGKLSKKAISDVKEAVDEATRKIEAINVMKKSD